jgi:hypothetical protein
MDGACPGSVGGKFPWLFLTGIFRSAHAVQVGDSVARGCEKLAKIPYDNVKIVNR